MKIKLVYTDSKIYNGIKSYSLNLYNDMSKVMDVKLKPLSIIQVSFKGKKFGGWITSEFFSLFVGNADIVHSTAHWSLQPHTNVVTIHDLFPLTMKQYFNNPDYEINHQLKKLENVNKKAKYIIVQTSTIKNNVEKYIKNVPIAVIPSKIFVNQPTKNPYPDDKKLHLLTMGIIEPFPQRKQIYDLYEWIKDKDDVDLYHIGLVNDKRYIDYSKNIHQIDSVSQQDKFNYMAYADKYVFKTLGEGQGYPVMEAMKLNTQTVINDLPEHRELLGDKPYYFHNKDEFLEMIYKSKKSGLVEQISQYDNWIDKYKKVYEEVRK